MTRPIMLADGSDNRTIIPAFGMRQCLSKDTGLAGGNINVDFTTADTTDPDTDGGTLLIEPDQAYIAAICRLAEAALTQVIIININVKTNGVFSVQPHKAQIADNMLFIPIHLMLNQDTIRFRFNALAVTDNIRTTLWKIS